MPRLTTLSRVVAILGISALLGVDFAARAADIPGPTEAIRGTMSHLIRILEDQALKGADRMDERRLALEAVVKSRVSYEEMAKRALGSQWTSLTGRERQEFIELFIALLRDSFANHVTALVDEQVQYLGEQQYDAAFAEVHTRLTGVKVDTSVDFRIINKGGEWLVYDVVVDGASIVYNYRSQFMRVMKDAAYPGLVKQLKDRTVATKRFEMSPDQ